MNKGYFLVHPFMYLLKVLFFFQETDINCLASCWQHKEGYGDE